MRINRLIDDYSPTCLQKEVQQLLAYQNVVFKIESKSPLSNEDLLKMPVSSLIYSIDTPYLQSAQYLGGLEPQMLPHVEDLYDINYTLCLSPQGDKAIKKGFVGKSMIPKEEHVSDIDYQVSSFYIIFTFVPKMLEQDFFDKVSVFKMFKEALDMSVLMLGDKWDEGKQKNRHQRINFNPELKTYVFNDFGFKTIEQFKLMCRFLFLNVYDDDKLYELVANLKYENSRPLLASNTIKIHYHPDRINSYKSLFELD